MVGVRLPAACVRRIDKMAAEIGAPRSVIIRLMLEHVFQHGSPEVQTYRSVLMGALLGWKGRGRVADQIASATMERTKALATAYFAARSRSKRRGRRADIIEPRPTRAQLLRT
jgi:hypothetical protein